MLALISDLERSAPFKPSAPGASESLLGEWSLVFASDGTVVTRTAPAQLLAQLATVPGVGLSDIQQQLDHPVPGGWGLVGWMCDRMVDAGGGGVEPLRVMRAIKVLLLRLLRLPQLMWLLNLLRVLLLPPVIVAHVCLLYLEYSPSPHTAPLHTHTHTHTKRTPLQIARASPMQEQASVAAMQ